MIFGSFDVMILPITLMRKLLFLILTFGLLASETALSKEFVEEDISRTWEQYESEISRLWKVQNEFLDHHTQTDSNQIFDQILFLKENYEVDQIPVLSKALLRKITTQQRLENKLNHPFYKMALQLSPDHYSNDYFLCEFHWEPVEWPLALKSCFTGLSKELSQPGAQLVLLSKLSFMMYWTIVALLLFFFSLLIQKFLPFVTQYYSSNFYWISPASFLFLILTVSLLIFFTFGWLFLVAFFYVFLWRFPGAKEKAFLLLLICLIMSLPFTFIAPSLSRQYNDGIVSELSTYESTIHPSSTYSRLKRHVLAHPRDAQSLFVLGMLEKKLGNYENAKSYFELSQNVNINVVKTKLNLANVHYQMGDTDTAKAMYKKIIQEYPTYIPTYINLSQVYTYESNYLDGESYITQASQIDEKTFKQYSRKLLNKRGGLKLIYDELSPKDFHDRMFQTEDLFKSYFNQFFSYYFPRYTPQVLYMTLIFSILIAMLFHITTNTQNFYFLYFNREKTLEKLTLNQLKEYPNAFKSFAKTIEFRDRLLSVLNHAIPGYYFFWNNDHLISIFMAGLFFFLTAGYMNEASIIKINDAFPWKTFFTVGMIGVFISNFIYVHIRIHYGQTSDKK